MRFRIKTGGAAVHITFDRTPKPQPPAPPSPRAADLDNPYGRYYGKAPSHRCAMPAPSEMGPLAKR